MNVSHRRCFSQMAQIFHADITEEYIRAICVNIRRICVKP